MDEAGVSATVQQSQLRAWPYAARGQNSALALAVFPRARLGHFPTPLEPMDRLAEHLDSPRIWVKRDDCTSLSSGGKKTRKPEFLMADVLGQGADTIITQGATQSNHTRQTAAVPSHAAQARASDVKRLCVGTVSGPPAMTWGRAMTFPPKA